MRIFQATDSERPELESVTWIAVPEGYRVRSLYPETVSVIDTGMRGLEPGVDYVIEPEGEGK